MEWRTYWWEVQLTATNKDEENQLKDLYDSLDDKAKEWHDFHPRKEESVTLETGCVNDFQEEVKGLTLEIHR